jgi:hypothetical protein
MPVLRSITRAFASRLGRLLAFTVVVMSAFVARPSAGRPLPTRFDALPRSDERLAQPLWLPNCGMRIVEWRSSPALGAETASSDEALAVIDDTCREVFSRYEDFLRERRLPHLRGQADVLPAVSLLPGNVLLDGKAHRALNDLPTRFESVAPGCCYWGLYVDSLNHLFLRNDPLTMGSHGKLEPNPRFVRTLTHELSHVLSSRLGVWDIAGYDRDRDEELAEQFVAFMGMHFPAESSAEDLAFHKRHGGLGEPASDTATAAQTEPSKTTPPSASANTSPQR